MYSNRIANFEYGNTENSHAWHTADGMVYLYNNDLNQFGEGYWTTVDPYRLPGTTVDTVSLPDGAKSSSKSPQAWVGGATDGITASVGMALNKANEGQNLKAMKSWFCWMTRSSISVPILTGQLPLISKPLLTSDKSSRQQPR